MFTLTLRPSKSDRSLTKLKRASTNLSWSRKSTKAPSVSPEVDVTAFRSGLSIEQDHHQNTTCIRRSRCISTRNAKRDTILIDLTNNEEFAPALDYAFAILDDADDSSTRSLSPPPSLKHPVLSRGSSFNSCDIPFTSTFSPSSYMSPSVRSAPPRYVYVSSPLSSSSTSSNPSTHSSPQKPSAKHEAPSRAASFDPHELSLALTQAQSNGSPDIADPPSPTSVPFPPPAIPPVARVPLIQRKPRLLHSADSSIDGHEWFLSRSCPGSSKVSLARSVSSLEHHHREVFASRGACQSTTSVDTIDSTLSTLLAHQPIPRTPYSPLKLFSSPKKSRPTPTRRASTPPPCRTRLGIPSTQHAVPALPEVLIGPAARREAISDSNYLLSRSRR